MRRTRAVPRGCATGGTGGGTSGTAVPSPRAPHIRGERGQQEKPRLNLARLGGGAAQEGSRVPEWRGRRSVGLNQISATGRDSQAFSSRKRFGIPAALKEQSNDSNFRYLPVR